MFSLNPSRYLKGLPLDYCTNFSKVSSYFAKNYQEINPGKRKVSDDVITCIESYNKKINAPPTVFENIEALKEERPVICTGQQPCLLTGPLFVIYKALTAVVLAERVKGVPVFWNASEDDDVSEVNHIWVLNSDLKKISVDLEVNPFNKIRVEPADLQYIIDQLEELTPPTEFRADVLRIIEKCSQPFSQSFSRILSTLLSDYGLIVVEPEIFTGLAAPVYQKLIEHPVKAAQLVNKAGSFLESSGYKRQLHKPDNSCSFYLLFDDKRHAVFYNGKFQANNDTFTKKELFDLLDEHPECFSSNVISRPVIQDFLFSTLAYCAGPGEISYFAQMKEVYQFFDIEEPHIIPRFGTTVVEKKVQKVLEKYSIDVYDLENPERILKTLARGDISNFFNKSKGEVIKTLQKIEEYMNSVDPNLKRTSRAMQTRILKDLAALEEKTATAVKREKSTMETQIMKASTNVFPHRMLQERVLNIFQYVIRYKSLIEDLYQNFQNAPLGEHILFRPGD